MNNQTIQRLKSRKGFDLVQLLIVVVILGALAVIATTQLLPLLGKGDSASANSNLNTAIQAAKIYQADNSGTTTEWAVSANAAKTYIEAQSEGAVDVTVAASNPNTSAISLSSEVGSKTATGTVSPDQTSTKTLAE